MQNKFWRLSYFVKNQELFTVILSLKTFLLSLKTILRALKSLTLVLQHLSLRRFIPIFSLDFTEPLKSCSVLNTQLKLTCGVLDASLLNFSQEMLSSPAMMNMSRWGELWKLEGFRLKISFLDQQELIISFLKRQINLF